MPAPPLIGEDDPQRVLSLVRVLAAAIVARRMGPLPPPLARALEDLEEREPEWMARLEGRAAQLLTTTGP